MSFGNSYGDTKHVPTEKENLHLLERAVELGVTFIDTADVYGSGLSEVEFGKALKGNRKPYQVATKFGWIFKEFVPGHIGISGAPEFVRQQVESSLRRLGTDHIDLLYQHRVDRTRPIEETWRELKKLVEEGKVKYLGISEATPDEVRRAHAIHPISAIQLEWSLWTRNVEEDIVPLARELGIGIVPYSPLGRGFLTGSIASLADLNPDDRRKTMPRFQEGNLERNVELVSKLKDLAKEKNISPAQLALAWLHAQGDDVFPIPGTMQVKYLESNAAAFFVKLSKEEVQYLNDLFKPENVQGNRYGQAQAAHSFEHASARGKDAQHNGLANGNH